MTLSGLENPQEFRSRLEADLPRLSNLHSVPGVAVAVSSGSDLIEAGAGVINNRTQIPVTSDSLFQIQSVTKLFTATLVMQLCDEGQVALDEPVRTYLPSFRTADAAASEQITVRHLLTHSGGFEGDLWQPTTTGPDALERFVDDLVPQAPQHSRPGQRFSYCNSGFGTLGRLVEVLRESTFEEALRRHIAEPLGLEHLAFTADQALAFRTAIGHVSSGPGQPLQPIPTWGLMPLSNPSAGAQLAMSAGDLVRFGRAFISGGLLSPETTALMLQPHLKHHGETHQGLGWRIPAPGLAEHGGGAPGVVSFLKIAPAHGLAVAVLTNADAGVKLAGELLDQLFADIAPSQAAPTPENKRVLDPVPVLGRYSIRQHHYEVTQDADGRLWLSDEPRNESVTMALTAGTPSVTTKHEIRPLTPDTFALLGDDGQAAGTVVFLEPADDRRFGFLAVSGRVASRTV